MRWYINDILVMELNANAFKGGTNDAGQSVGDRLIPEEPSYIIANLAMSNNFAPIDPNLPLPASLEVGRGSPDKHLARAGQLRAWPSNKVSPLVGAAD